MGILRRSYCVSDIQLPTVVASTGGWSFQEGPRIIPGKEERMSVPLLLKPSDFLIEGL